jgi:phosphatidylserine/phosphatidylglycerophosphate/cardiolipin synthase-like enzyme
LTEFNRKYDYKFDENIVKSPFNTREKFNELFTKVKQNVKFYIQNFSDKETFESIKSLLNKGIEVKIIIPSYKRIKNNEKYIEPLIKL